MNAAFENEVESLENDYNLGFISLEELNKGMRELERDYIYEAEEAAQEAYDTEMEQW